jgi:hypothetical protein
VLKIFGREVAAAMCYGIGGGAFSTKLLRGQGGHGFRNIALEAMVRKCPLLHPLRTISAPLHFANCGGATCPRPPHLHMVL